MVQTRAMAGQKIPVLNRLREGWNIFREHRTSAWGGALVYKQRYEQLAQLVSTYSGKDIVTCRTLEIGCGQRAVMPVVLAAKGAESYAVDVEVPTYRMTPAVFVQVLRRNGLDRALKSAMRHTLFDRGFFAEIRKVFDIDTLPFTRVHVKVVDAAVLDYPDSHFDLIFSAAAFEHIADVEAAVRNVGRMLRPDGIALIHAHLFASLSGGHVMDWQQPDTKPSTSVPPWDHLRENRYAANVYLNRLRLRDYRDLFDRYTAVRSVSTSREGLALVHLIPPSLLQTYTVEELTTNSVQFVVSKK